MGRVADRLTALLRVFTIKPAPYTSPDYDRPARPDPVGPGQTLLRGIDANYQAEHHRGLEEEQTPRSGRRYDPRYG